MDASYLFGEFCLDVAAGELRRGSAAVHLTPTNYDLLLCLVSRPGELVTKDELIADVWANATVGEGSLSRAIATIRQALGDSSREPRYIATVAWRGYRFVAPVQKIPRAAQGTLHGVLAHASGGYPVRAGATVLGRGADCDVVILGSTVSRRHARISTSGIQPVLEDLGSRNGTFVNGQRLSAPCPLRDGDQIRLGSEVLDYSTRTLDETEPLPEES